MKRALAMGLGALMVAGTAAPVSAASHIDFSGYYRIQYMNEVNTGYGNESRSFTDSYFQDRLNIDLTFRPTDEIAVYWRLRGPSYGRWGTNTRGNKNLYTQFIYGEIKQDWGTVLIGRLSDDLDCAGLCTFGYYGNESLFTQNAPFDRGDIMDGIRYSYDWDNGFSILAQYVKLDNNMNRDEWGNQTDRSSNWKSDQDYDRFQVQVAYAWDGGGASLHAYYDRDATGNGEAGSYGWGLGNNYGRLAHFNQRAMYTQPINDVPGANRGANGRGRLGGLNKIETWGINPSIMHTFGDFSVHFEGMATWGTAQYLLTNGRTYDQDGEGYGAYLDFDYNYGPGNVTLAGWWVSGTDLTENPDDLRDKNKSLANLVGGNFYPLLVAYNGGNNNPGENRYFGNGGNHVSGIGFANNGYENYIYEGHMGRVMSDTAYSGNPAHIIADTPTANFTANNFAALNSYTLGGNTYNYNLGAADAGGGIAKNSYFVSDVMGANRTRTTSFNNDTDANHWAIALTGAHAFTDDITMNYGIGYLALNKPNYRVAKNASYNNAIADRGDGFTGGWDRISYATQDKDLGFELDLGFTVQLLDNLKFTTAFGYMFNGDAYKQLKGYKLTHALPGENGLVQHNDSVRAVWEDADDSYVWFNSLTFAF